MPLLFATLVMRGVALSNRVVVSPMCTYAATEGFATNYHAIHYGKFAMGGAGLVLLEATAVLPEGRISNGCLGLWSDDRAEALRPIAEILVEHGSVPGIQLSHAGRKSNIQRAYDGNGPLTHIDVAKGEKIWGVVGPSDIPFGDGWHKPREMSERDMGEVCEAFAAAAHRAVKVGFKVVELHMAHGYLLQSFLSPLANRRDDNYGGSLGNRMRFPLRVVAAIREILPADVPLFARISAVDWIEGGWRMEDTLVLCRELQAIGIDVIDCSSGGNLAQGINSSKIPQSAGYQAGFAKKVRMETGMLTQAVGLIRTPQLSEQLLEDGTADLIAIGRQMLYNPFWAHHAKRTLVPDVDFRSWDLNYAWWLERWATSLSRRGEQP